MKTRTNHRMDSKIISASPEGVHFATVKYIVTYLCCGHCDQPMVRSNVAIWKEDINGKAYDVNFLHYKCEKPFKETHKGKWFSKGMLSPQIVW